MVGKRAVTLYDKRKAKNSVKIFAILTSLFTVVSTLSIIFLPRAKTITNVQSDKEDLIKTMTPTSYGDDYAVASTKYIERYSSDSNELLESLNFSTAISNKVSVDTGLDLTKGGTFESPTIHYEETDANNGTLYFFDSDGDIFKFKDNNKQFTLDNDYYLTSYISLKEKSTDSDYSVFKEKNKFSALCFDQQYLYVLSIDYDNFYYINVFDKENLSVGPIKSKYLYTTSNPTATQKSTYGDSNIYIINKIKFGNGENPYNIAVEGDYLYIFTSYGLIRWNKDLTDNGTTSFLGGMESFVTSKCFDYVSDPNNLSNEIKEQMLGSNYQNILTSISNNKFSILQIFNVAKNYKSDFPAYINQIRVYGETFKQSNSTWCKGCNPHKDDEKMVISKSIANKDYNISVPLYCIDLETFDYTTQKMGGACYSPFNQKMYYLDLTSSSLYSLSLSSLNTFTLNGVYSNEQGLAQVSTMLEGMNFSDHSLYSNRGNISYDKNSHNIHITYNCSKDITVVDLNETTPKIKYTLSLEYDVRSFIETKTNNKVVALYPVVKRTINNILLNPLYIMNVTPSVYKYHGFVLVMFFVSMILAVVSLIALLISIKTLKKAASLLKAKVIARDFKRHKFTYLALIPFVILLIMFCWVEAIGSISFSFFDYTSNKPAYIWNNLGNFIQIFNDKNFMLMLGNTAFFLVFDLFLGLVPPIIFAFFLSIIKHKKLSGFLRGCMFIPAIIPGIATLLIWKIGIFGDNGILNQLICLFKTGHTSSSSYTPVAFLLDTNLSRWSLLLMGFPYVGGYLIFYGGIMNIPKEYDEACQLEGIGVIKRFVTIDLPLIKPQIKYILVMGILSSVQNYERTYMLGSNGTTTLVETMYRKLQMTDPNYGLASAYATIIFALLIIPVFLNFRSTKKNTLGDAL